MIKEGKEFYDTVLLHITSPMKV